MLKDSLSTLLFVFGFCLTVPALPWALWTHSAQTEHSLILLMLSLPVYVWACAYAYFRTFNLAEALILEYALLAQGWLADKAAYRPRRPAYAAQPRQALKR